MRRVRKISGIKTDVAFVTKANFFPPLNILKQTFHTEQHTLPTPSSVDLLQIDAKMMLKNGQIRKILLDNRPEDVNFSVLVLSLLLRNAHFSQ